MDALNPRSLTREQLARFLPTHELIKAFEKLFDLASATPDEVNTLTLLVEEVQGSADSATAAAGTAAAIAHLALAIARELNEGPPPIQLQLEQQVDDLTGRLAALDAQLSTLARRVADLEERPTP
jgi:hypothetical protein